MAREPRGICTALLTYLYLFSLIVGFVLLGASILLGGSDDADLDTDADLDGGLDLDADGDLDFEAEGGLDKDLSLDLDSEGGHGDFSGFLLTFLSLRFWTFFLAFFGLTGLVLDGLDLVSSSMIGLGAAIGMGFVTGFGAVSVFRKLSGTTAGAITESNDYIGKTARVMVPFGNEGVGKVRVDIRGNQVDLLATGLDEDAFEGREEVLIVEMDGPRARVARLSDKKRG
ncbi:MAG: NfeD family protein [Sandaracinaceae bacterium]